MQIDFKKSSLCYDKENIIVKCPVVRLRPQALLEGEVFLATITEVPGVGQVSIYIVSD